MIKKAKILQKLSLKRKFVLALLIFLPFLLCLYLFWGLPAPWDLTSSSYPVSTQILDRQGRLLYEVYAEQNRTPVKLAELPQYVKWATISSEDKDFYQHHGFSGQGIIRATFNTLFRRKLQGGSTITQQLVKNALLSPDRTIKRKIREFALTVAVETIYSKDEILQMYLNHTPYGGTAWGIQAAAQLYFGKNAKDLTLAEAALLAGLPASPTRYSPFGAHPELAKQRQEFSLARMVEDKHLSEEEAQKAKEERLIFAGQGNKIQAPHFVMYVKDQLASRYGEKLLEQGGLRVTTTLDLDIQDFAQTTIASEVGKLKKAHVTNGATLVTQPKTGEILSMVGSKDYFDSESGGNFNVTTALRQPGSAIKPVNYALGLLNKKITLATVFNDMPTCFLVAGQPPYCPENYDNSFHGPVQARFALGNSYNLPAVKMLTLNTLEEFVPFAQKMGLSTLEDPKKYGLSLTLGGGEVKMTDMAVAFGVFANQGTKQPLVSILKVEDYKGKVLDETKISQGEKVLGEDICYLISHTLLDNNARAATFGTSSYLNVSGHPEVSVKTGTTNDKRDNWTIGFSSDFLVVTWVGNNDNTPMGAVASGVSGASPAWNKIIGFTLRKNDLLKYVEKTGKSLEEIKEIKVPPYNNWPIKPEEVAGASICSLSGKLPGEGGCPTRFEYFLKGTIPTEIENLKQTLLINKDTGQPVMPGETPANFEFQDHSVIVDFLGTIFCLDCPPSPTGTASAKIKVEDIKSPL